MPPGASARGGPGYRTAARWPGRCRRWRRWWPRSVSWKFRPFWN